MIARSSAIVELPVMFHKLADSMLTLVTFCVAPVKTELFNRATFTAVLWLSTNISPDKVTLPVAVRLATLCPCAEERNSTPFPGSTKVPFSSNIDILTLSSI